MNKGAAFPSLSEMEDDILAVGRWSGVLNHLGTSATMIDPAEIWVIAGVLRDLGQRLDARWNEAFDAAARGRS